MSKMSTKEQFVGRIFIIVSLILVIISIILGEKILTIPGLVYSAVTVGIAVTAIGHIISFFIGEKTGKNYSKTIIPLTGLAIAFISFLPGVVMYIRCHREILGDLSAWIVWISIPSLITAGIHFIVSKVKR